LKSKLNIWLTLALRFVLRHRRKTIATGSFILIGTAVLVLIHSFTVGINDTMVLNTTHLHYGHAYIDLPSGTYEAETVAKHVRSKHDVEDVLVRYRFTTLISSSGRSVPAMLYAVDPLSESEMTAIAGRITEGRYPDTDKKEILLGSGLAGGLTVKDGDSVSIAISGNTVLSSFNVSGIYSTGIDRYDDSIAFIPEVQLSAGMKEKLDAEVSVFLKRSSEASHETKMINRHIPPDRQFKTWDELMPDLVQLIEMNEVSMKIIMVLVFGLVGFGISNNFILTLVERFREFGILKAMGVTPGELIFLVFLESFIVCVCATMLGLFSGGLLTELISVYGIDFGYFTSHNRYFVVTGMVYPRITLAGLLWPGVIAVAVSLISSFIPARIAAKKITAETMRFS
jgi:ABC-type lipoprotein release transport system permease subunit